MGKQRKSRNGGLIVRKRTSIQHDPRASKRARTAENDDPNTSQSASRRGSPSPGPSQGGMPDINASMSQEQLYQAARQFQAQNNELHHSQQEAARDALADVTNDGSSDDDDAATAGERKFVRSLGKKCIVTKLIWMPDEDAVFENAVDDNYNPLERFSKELGTQPQARIQGAIRDLLELIPKNYQTPDQLNGFVKTEFLAGMKDQRYAYRNGLRANPALFGRTIPEFQSSAEREKLTELVGRRLKKNKTDEYYYDTFNVPLLHEDYDGEFDVDKIFLNEKLFIVETVDKLWGLKKTTPSMIAGEAVWLRWIHSRDEESLPIGDVTSIDWAREYDAYMRFLMEGLDAQTDCVLNIFRRWDM
ncbi:hypothetical protein GGX14DRAFT_570269 [Mycena pura]|uniref:Uncharacterized protein n=1 Tax=Mycena pura TaxID=153505 RepID=A0AAD6YCV8_9AGAR|nr:hypothetical protein GGX14DRAFT_570269 [Mycena pura]